MAAATVIVPVLDRPERVEPLIVSLARGVDVVPYDWLFVASPGDDREIRELERVGAPHIVVGWPPGPGDWAKKINVGHAATSAPWVFTGADDLCFCPGWLDRALACAAATGARVVGTDDCYNQRVVRGEHATHNLVARSYVGERGTIDEPGKVIHEGYDHNFCDDELVATARARGEWAFCAASVVEHLHPLWGKATWDGTYSRGQAEFEDDRRRFEQRARLWAAAPGATLNP